METQKLFFNSLFQQNYFAVIQLDLQLRVCLNFVFVDQNDEFFVLMRHIFKGIATAIAANP